MELGTWSEYQAHFLDNKLKDTAKERLRKQKKGKKLSEFYFIRIASHCNYLLIFPNSPPSFSDGIDLWWSKALPYFK